MGNELTAQQKQSALTRLQTLTNSPSVKARFEQVLGERSGAFISSIISAVSGNKQLLECEPMSVIASGAVAASMDLPINSSLGFAHIVPYRGVAQFQIGWKGFIQLAMRTGKYKTINATEVYEGQITSFDHFTGKMQFCQERESEKVIGYLLYFELTNGFEKYFYMTKEDCEKHGKKYSATFKKGFGQWKDNFDAMALKTVVKLGLSKYGILSIDMQKAITVDQAEVDQAGEVVDFPDAIVSVESKVTMDTQPKKEGPSKLKKAISKPSDEPPTPTEDNSEEVPI